MAFERLLRLTKKCPGYVVSGLRNASVGIATVTQKSFESQYYIPRALFGTRSLFAMTATLETQNQNWTHLVQPIVPENTHTDGDHFQALLMTLIKDECINQVPCINNYLV